MSVDRSKARQYYEPPSGIMFWAAPFEQDGVEMMALFYGERLSEGKAVDSVCTRAKFDSYGYKLVEE